MLLRGDNRGDQVLRNGDVVFVPMMGAQIEIEGEVLRPAIYEINDGDTVSIVMKEFAALSPPAIEETSR